ncbi:MAG: efflux RND transporter permease subunit [Bacteroidales bacterium]|nr:efflux RND transporter permease subunit [Bacteroidales bacterium]MDY2710241.1 efflux RND transporter permease subunit [Sodaliphilus sp.]MCI6656419.1 efflux RND transporter permease subunit [Bacteroidales bacterium]MCI6902808.1 efflux RND transporter permease subunit [Bacteroidales bacterium]MCI7033110.1 efflux RND transporter permease subunit [Bacteroidales bacterium]
MSLYSSAVKKPVTTILVFVAVVIIGLFSLLKLPIDLYPDIDTNTIMVMTTYSGASSQDIEQNVTRPLENTLNSVEHLKHITSNSKENISIITLEFEYGYDIDVLTNSVRDKLDMVSSMLPDDAETPIIFKFSTDMIPIVLLSAQANESLPGLYKILDENVANTLARVDGVGTVSISGAPKREIHIYLDPARLEAYNLTAESVIQLVAAENKNVPGGTFDMGSDTYSLRVQGEFKDPTEMRDLVVGSKDGAVVRLSDVARIDDSVEERAQETYNNGQRGAMIIVQKQSGANSVEISNKIKKILPDIQKKLPSDVKLDYIVDTSDNIRNTIASLVETVEYALLFVVIVVFFFLGRWRATVIIALTIPISLIASFIYLLATGNTLNIVSLSALSISIGMVVDDAIVVLENVTTHIERGSDPKQAAVHGTNEVAISVIASTLTLIAVFFPLTLVTGMTGVLFRQLGWMVSIMMVISTAAALSLTPMLCSQLLRLQPVKGKLFTKLYGPIERFLDKLDDGFYHLLGLVVKHRWITTVGALLIFFGSMQLTKFIGSEFFPTSDNSRLGITLELPVGSRVEIAKDLTERIYKDWTKKYPEIDKFNYTVGQASTDNIYASMQSNGSHIISMNITLKPIKERTKSLTEVAALMREDLKKYPELDKYQVNVGGSRGGSMSGQSTIDYEIYGYDFEKTDSVAQRLKRILSSVKGTADIRISRDNYQPEYQVDFDRQKLAIYGLNLTTAANALRNRINGSTASYFREDGDEYDIKVMYDPDHRQSIEDIENILLFNAQGKGVRLKEVGTVVERFNPPTIERKDRERIITVSTVVQDRPMSDIIADAQPLIDKMEVPSGVSINLSGSYEDQQDSFRDLAMLAVLIIILVYIVMASQFESFTYPGIIMTSIMFAFSGVVLILWITGTNLNVMSMIGGIMLIGIVVKNGIVLIDYITLNRERGMSITKSVLHAGKSRMRPVLMTSLTTILGMVPMAVGTGEGAEMWRPMGVAVIGGLTFSTILTLLFVPTLYTIFAFNGVRRQRRKLHKALEMSNSKNQE